MTGSVKSNRGLSLIADSHRRNLGRRNSCLFHHIPDHLQGIGIDFLRVVAHPSLSVDNLPVRKVCPFEQTSFIVKKQCLGSLRALINSKYVSFHIGSFSSGNRLFGLCRNSLCIHSVIIKHLL